MVRKNLTYKDPASRRTAWLMATGMALLLPACSAAPTVAEGGAIGATTLGEAAAACDARVVQDLVGKHASALIVEGARQRAGAVRGRMIGHDEIVTKEYDPGRLNLQLDPQGRVSRIYCG